MGNDPGSLAWEGDGLMDRLPDTGVAPDELTDEDLLRELASLHRTRNDTFRHGSDDALAEHDRRSTELEAEYLLRFPQREVDPARLRP